MMRNISCDRTVSHNLLFLWLLSVVAVSGFVPSPEHNTRMGRQSNVPMFQSSISTGEYGDNDGKTVHVRWSSQIGFTSKSQQLKRNKKTGQNPKSSAFFREVRRHRHYHYKGRMQNARQYSNNKIVTNAIIRHNSKKTVSRHTPVKNEAATMFVGNLDYDSTSQELRQVFREFGKVKSLSLPLNKKNGGSRGFAFVTMENLAGMETAIRELDGSRLHGRRIRVLKAEQNKSDVVRSSKLFIGNVPPSTSRQELLHHFKVYKVKAKSIVIPADKISGRPLDFAFAMVPKQDVEFAITALDGCTFKDRSLRVKKATQRTHTTFFVGGLSYWMETEKIREHFEQYGTIVNCRAPGGSKLCRGSVLVTMPVSEADHAMHSIHGLVFDDRVLRVEKYLPLKYRINNKKSKYYDQEAAKDEASNCTGAATEKSNTLFDVENHQSRRFDFVPPAIRYWTKYIQMSVHKNMHDNS